MTLTISDAFHRAAGKLDAVEARALLRHILGRDDAWLIAHAAEALGAGEQRAFKALVARRAAGEPVAYLTGEREFYGLAYKVTPAVLIPRPETELLVDLALDLIPQDAPLRVLDLATGSGCVAVAIARHRPRAQVTATDVEPAALELARENARRHGARNIEFAQSDWFGALSGRRFELLVANPPYVAAGDPHLEQGDLRFEPRAALAAGANGLDGIRAIAAQARAYLVTGGWLLFEHGFEQAEHSRALLAKAGFGHVFSRADLAGIERVSGGKV